MRERAYEPFDEGRIDDDLIEDDRMNQDKRYNVEDDSDQEGIVNTHLTAERELEARRAELARQLSDVLADAADWLETTDAVDAREIYEALEAVYERLSEPPEQSDEATRER